MNTIGRRTVTTLALALTGVLALAGCGALDSGAYPADGPTVTATSNPQQVTAGQFGHAWPFTVDNGEIACTINDDGNPLLSFTAPDGTAYALNAVDGSRQLEDIAEIRDASIGPVRSFAFSVCDVGPR